MTSLETQPRQTGQRAGWVAIAVAFLSLWEGMSLKASHQPFDPAGVITACIGMTNYDRPLKAGERFTPAQCREYLAEDLPKYDACVTQNVKVAMPDPRHAAMVSFVYNVGCANFRKSSVLRQLNAGNTEGACNALLAWNRADGRVLQGLVNRRNAERELCLRAS